VYAGRRCCVGGGFWNGIAYRGDLPDAFTSGSKLHLLYTCSRSWTGAATADLANFNAASKPPVADQSLAGTWSPCAPLPLECGPLSWTRDCIFTPMEKQVVLPAVSCTGIDIPAGGAVRIPHMCITVSTAELHRFNCNRQVYTCVCSSVGFPGARIHQKLATNSVVDVVVVSQFGPGSKPAQPLQLAPGRLGKLKCGVHMYTFRMQPASGFQTLRHLRARE
jgi:hypothetical protein